MEAGLSDLVEEIAQRSAIAQEQLEMGREYMERVVKRIDPAIQVFFFGSRSYGAALPKSDVDCGIILPPTVGVPAFFQKVAQQLTQQEAKDVGFAKVRMPRVGWDIDRLETEFRGFPWDLACGVQSRANHGGAKTSDAMNLLRLSQTALHGLVFWKAQVLFRSLLHGAGITQHHGDVLKSHYKAICCMVMCIVWLEGALRATQRHRLGLPTPRDTWLQHYKQWPLTAAVGLFEAAFLHFPWNDICVGVTRVSECQVVPKKDTYWHDKEKDCWIFMGLGFTNCNNRVEAGDLPIWEAQVHRVPRKHKQPLPARAQREPSDVGTRPGKAGNRAD